MLHQLRELQRARILDLGGVMARKRYFDTDESGVMTKPPFGERAKSTTPHSITSAFCTSNPRTHAKYSGRCRMRKDQILPQQRVIGRPFCEFCKAQMWLACIEPDEPDHDKRTFKCPVCPNITVRVVKYRSSNSDLEIKLVSRRA